MRYLILLLILSSCAELEIYTLQDIYYVNGLNVTSESTDLNITFGSMTELREWLSKRTADDCSYENIYLVDDRDYPDDCLEVYSDMNLIGHFCPVRDGVHEFVPL